MSVPLEDLARTFAFHDQVIWKLTHEFDGADWLARVGEARAHPYWLVGHLTAHRAIMIEATGGDPAPFDSYVEGFGRGTEPGESMPIELDRLVGDLREAGQRLVERMRGMTEAELAGPSKRRFPDGSETVGGQLHFMSFHEAYHIGQLAMIARARGKPGLA